jgi:hypothetical protein
VQNETVQVQQIAQSESSRLGVSDRAAHHGRSDQYADRRQRRRAADAAWPVCNTDGVADRRIQQPLNPGLANYPDYIAGEAVKAVISPDGKILAILTAGFNSLFKAYVAGSPATVDKAASTQFIFLYDVSGHNQTKPVLMQVIQQLNSHVGLVWAPNSQMDCFRWAIRHVSSAAR